MMAAKHIRSIRRRIINILMLLKKKMKFYLSNNTLHVKIKCIIVYTYRKVTMFLPMGSLKKGCRYQECHTSVSRSATDTFHLRFSSEAGISPTSVHSFSPFDIKKTPLVLQWLNRTAGSKFIYVSLFNLNNVSFWLGVYKKYWSCLTFTLFLSVAFGRKEGGEFSKLFVGGIDNYYPIFHPSRDPILLPIV